MSVLPAAGGSLGAGSHVAWGAALPQAGVTLREGTGPGAGVVRERVTVLPPAAMSPRPLPHLWRWVCALCLPRSPAVPFPTATAASSADHGPFWRRCLWLEKGFCFL